MPASLCYFKYDCESKGVNMVNDSINKLQFLYEDFLQAD